MENITIIISKIKHMNNQIEFKFPDIVDPSLLKQLQKFSEKDEIYISVDKNSHIKYPIINNIPRMLPKLDNYADAFGAQWTKWRKTQLDSHSGTTITKKRLYRCLGEDIVNQLNKAANKFNILEVGCGAGRFTEVLLNLPASYVTSIDLSNAVEANQENCPQNERHRILQADVMKIPFLKEQFDIVFCLGVVQHTPNPEETIKKLYEQLKPGGFLIIDHYRPEIRRLTKITGGLIRPIIKRLPTHTRIKTCEKLVKLFLPIHKKIRNIPFAQQIFSRISPIACYYHAYPELPDNLQFEWSVLDTHDGLTDWYKHYRTKSQITNFLSLIGANNIVANVGGNGIEARCTKPNK